jgi:hypothetical protein
MLLDTSGLLCLHYQTEPLHTQACTAYTEALSSARHFEQEGFIRLLRVAG